MAENKNKVVVYADWRDSFNELTDSEAGQLIKHFFSYVNDENPVLEDRVLRASWIPIEKTLKRDLRKWENTMSGRSSAGKASAEARRLLKLEQQNSTNSTNVTFVKTDLTNSTNVTFVKTDLTNSTVSVSDSVSVSDKDSIITNVENPKTDFDFNISKCLEFINKAFGKQYRSINAITQKKYKELLKQYGWRDVSSAILAVKDDKFHIESKYKYATPEFFTRPKTMDMYAFSSSSEPKYQGEDKKLVNHVNAYVKSTQS